MPTERIRESNELAFVVDDAFPVAAGHTLIIPRRHVSDFFDLTADEVGSLMTLLRTAQERLNRSFAPAGYNIGVKVGETAGQTVLHVHMHLIPRYTDDVPDPTGGIRNVISGKGRYVVE
jgi:diadenosine tetraphosphate (Ap4A) HIT family hydrolase